MKNDVSITYTGQAGFIIESSNNEKLGIDLYLSDCVEALEGHVGFRRLLPKPFDGKDVIFDFLIATHKHYDHFDYDSMYDLMNNNKTILFAAHDCVDYIEELKIDKKRVCFVKPNDKFEYGSFKLQFVECNHGEAAPKAVGVIVEVDNKRIYFTGDTCLRLDRVDYIKKFGEIDVCIGPINGMYGNMNEKEFALFGDKIDAKQIIPCHYGMFASHGGNIKEFYDLMRLEYSNRSFIMMRFLEKIKIC